MLAALASPALSGAQDEKPAKQEPALARAGVPDDVWPEFKARAAASYQAASPALARLLRDDISVASTTTRARTGALPSSPLVWRRWQLDPNQCLTGDDHPL